LGVMGAEVIHIEPPGTGDLGRGARKTWGIDLATSKSNSLLFEAFNRNKKSIGLDIHKVEGREVIKRLVEKSDVFATNLRMEGLKRLGADPVIVQQYNPNLIYARAGGFGSKGPDNDAPALDATGYARSGFMFTQASNENDPPIYLVGAIADVISATIFAFSIVTALLARERSGVRQEAYTSLLSGMLWLQYFQMAVVLNKGRKFEPHKHGSSRNPLINNYKCSDGRWMTLGLFGAERFWPKFCRAIIMEELLTDPRFETHEKRTENATELCSVLAELFATKTSTEWGKILKEAGLWHSVVNKPEEMDSDAQVIANNFILDFDSLRLVSFPFELSKMPITLTKGSPEFAQHTEEVLHDVCGYSWEEIVRLKELNVIA